ncbi:unnamed protein product [Caenorhabditis sp. 36 PRJEB53466]|nr:unnamed protein product [Caenorhabditis sp. 36 PRJEB53466]
MSANGNENSIPHIPPQQFGRGNDVPVIGGGGRDRRCEIYKFTSDQPLYASAWSNKGNIKFRLAVGTVSDVAANPKAANKVSIVQLRDESELVETTSFPMEFPANAVGFIPDSDNTYPDLLATTSDCLRLWRIVDGKAQPDAVMSNNTQYGSPLTSFDWNELEPRFIGVSSVDTTCTIYDVEVGTAIGSTRPTSAFSVKTQLIAHDKPVHDIEFSKINGGRDHFATVGADGSARMFDLRHLNHSTIVYEDPNKEKLQRLSWNKQEHYFLALFAENSQEVQILDIRMPCNILCRLRNHTGPVNGIAWAPHSPHHICTAGDDSQALIWDLQHVPRPIDDPILAYSAGGEVNQIHWGPVHSNWIAICFNKTLEILRKILPTHHHAKQRPQLQTAEDFRFVPRAPPVPATSHSAITPRMIDQSQTAPSSSSASSSHLMHHPHNFTTYNSHPNASSSSIPHNSMGHPNVGQPRMDPFNQMPTDLYGSSSSSSIRHPQYRPMMSQMPANDMGASTSAMHSIQQQPVDIYDNYGNASTSDMRRSSVRGDPRRKEIYAYNAPFTLFSHGWSAATDPSRKFRLAASSFIEEYSNKIHIVQLDEEAGELVHRSTFDHPYPATKIMWIPDQKETFRTCWPRVETTYGCGKSALTTMPESNPF